MFAAITSFLSALTLSRSACIVAVSCAIARDASRAIENIAVNSLTENCDMNLPPELFKLSPIGHEIRSPQDDKANSFGSGCCLFGCGCISDEQQQLFERNKCMAPRPRSST